MLKSIQKEKTAEKRPDYPKTTTLNYTKYSYIVFLLMSAAGTDN